MAARTLIAGLGNIFLGDDGFGVAVAQRLAAGELPDGVRVKDYGIRGMHFAYDLAQGWDTTILVDATRRGGEPGTVYVIEPEPGGAAGDGGAPAGTPLLDPHGMQPDVVLTMAGVLGEEAGRVLVVGCEPASMAEGIGLSPPVAAAVDEAARVVRRLAGLDPVPAGIQESPPSAAAEGRSLCAWGSRARWSSSCPARPTSREWTSAGFSG